MVSDFERHAIQRVVDQAAALGVDVPESITKLTHGEESWLGGAVLWARAHPDYVAVGCCWGEVNKGTEGCTCWVPVFDVVQKAPIPPTSPQDIQAQKRMCSDCAFRKDSKERAEEFTEEALLALPGAGTPFYCHEDMRRPVHWEHPDGRSIAGDPDDWQPPIVRGLPYRIDGRPGLLCAGWAARAARAGALADG
ncbi:hypothetical protein HH310_12450 [Actinoplanes sp. TBRC 11911]|uniref:hypothetical protein n=1 Tax=Actinoplanes sp. TBRC 11911 TaxID=2729386 RepID=UPI00145EE2EE|nr:hypothetical protein [Actinoplanes sp. TBRC 11911]NMO52004.1 hypothetical protein [Actinoplanes sp. TBRC 11911]